MGTTLERLLPTAKLVFDAVNGTPGCKGIVMGGLAAALLGSARKTQVGFIAGSLSGSLLTI
jgi:hypothetical protein